MLYEESSLDIITNKSTTVVWWNEICGNSSPYNAFWVSYMKFIFTDIIWYILPPRLAVN